MQIYRQGDVLIEKISDLPEDVELEDRDELNRIVLAHGEVTGHAHAVKENSAKSFISKKVNYSGSDSKVRSDITSFSDAERFLVVEDDGANVVHEEHSTIQLDKGVYKITRQREYAGNKEVRWVAD